MGEHRIVVHETQPVAPSRPMSSRLIAALVVVGGFLVLQTWASLEFRSVLKDPWSHPFSTIAATFLFGLTYLGELAAVLIAFAAMATWLVSLLQMLQRFAGLIVRGAFL